MMTEAEAVAQCVGALPHKLRHTLEAWPASELVQAAATRALLEQEVVNERDIYWMLKGLQAFMPTSAAARLLLCQVVAKCAKDEHACEVLSNQGAFGYLCDALRYEAAAGGPSSVGVARAATEACLARASIAAIAELLGYLDAVPYATLLSALYAAMAAHSDDAVLQAHACAALCNMTVKVAARAELVRTGGVARIYAAMAACPTSAEVQKFACMALDNIADPPDADQLRLVYAAMTAHAGDELLQTEACELLCRADAAVLAVTGGMTVVRAAVDGYLKCDRVQKAGCVIIARNADKSIEDVARLCTALSCSKGACKLAIDALAAFPPDLVIAIGALLRVSRVMDQQYAASKGVQYKGLLLFSTLVFGMGSVVDAAFAAEVEERVRARMDAWAMDADMQCAACAVYESLGGAMSTDGIARLLALLDAWGGTPLVLVAALDAVLAAMPAYADALLVGGILPRVNRVLTAVMDGAGALDDVDVEKVVSAGMLVLQAAVSSVATDAVLCADNGGLALICRAMGFAQRYFDAVDAGCCILAHVSRMRVDILLQCEALQRVCEALAAYPGRAQLQLHGCEVLWNVAASGEEGRAAVVAAGGLPPLRAVGNGLWEAAIKAARAALECCETAQKKAKHSDE